MLSSQLQYIVLIDIFRESELNREHVTTFDSIVEEL